MSEKTLKVLICRSHRGNQKYSEVPVETLSDFKWSNVSGGPHIKQAGNSIYAYLDYEAAPNLVNCSGQHLDTEHGNDAKVLICKPKNKKSEYWEGYQYALDQAGPKPPSQYSIDKQHGRGYCTTAIIQFLQDGPKTRGELRELLIRKGYTIPRIRQALKRLTLSNRISLSGSSYSKNQLISLPNNQ